MAKAKILQSNLIVKTKLPKPTGPGFKDVLSELKSIDKIVDKLNRKSIKIKVDLRGGKEAISSLEQILKVISASDRAQQKVAKAAAQVQQQATNATVRAQQTATQALRNSLNATATAAQRIKTIQKVTRTPEGTTVSDTIERFRREGTRSVREQFTQAGETEIEKTTKRDLTAEAAERIQNRRVTRPFDVEEQLRQQARQFQQRRAAGRRFVDEAKKEGFTDIQKTVKPFEAVGNPLKTFKAQIIEVSKTLGDGSRQFKTFSEATGNYSAIINRSTSSSNAFNNQQRRQIATQERLAELQKSRSRGLKLEQELTTKGFKQGPTTETRGPLSGAPGTDATTAVKTFTRQLADGRTQVIRFNEATNKAKSSLISNTQATRDAAKIQQIFNNQIQSAGQIATFEAQGFKRHGEQLKTFNIGTQQVTTTLTELRRVSGSALLGNLAVDIAKVDSATGKFTTRTLTSIDAMRVLGNTFTVAAAKVTTFLAATASAIYVFRGFAFAIDTIKELEKNTVFLARVGSELGASFDERLAGAQRLTGALIEQSVAIGVNATEAQQAAGVFLRAHQTEKEALQSTRAALIASRIAELDVAEAAKLLSAAQSQFNLKASQLLPTLDSLNTLSNTNRVSTDDLLQSISRAGSVFADNNGTLEQLAATTAVVARVTARTGSEIGNALKTISTRLTAPETLGQVFEKTGISMRDASGKTKNLTTVLLELQVALQKVNVADRSRLGVIIAGARQVNVLKAALNNVTDLVLEEARALRDASAEEKERGSATAELIDSSRTLEAVTLRLKAAFVQLFSQAGGALTTVLKSIAGALTAVLRLLSAFGSLPIVIGLAIASFILVRLALIRIGQSAAFASASALASTASITSLSTAYTFLTTAARTAAVSMSFATKAAAGATLGLSILIAVLATAEQSYTENQLSLDEYSDSLDRSAEVTSRKAKAVESLVFALFKQLEAQQEINKEVSTGNKIDKERQSLIQKNISKLTSPEDKGGGLGIGIPKGGVRTEEEIRKVKEQAFKLLRESRIETITESKERIKNEEEILKIQKEELSQAEAKLDRYRKGLDDAKKFGSSIVSVPGFFGLDFQKEVGLKEVSKLVREAHEEFLKLSVSTDTTEEKIKELKKTFDGLSAAVGGIPKSENFLKLFNLGNTASGTIKRLDEMESLIGETGSSLRSIQTQDAQNKLKDYEKALKDVTTSLTGLKDQTDIPALKKFAEDAVKAAEGITKIKNAARDLKIKELTEFFSKRAETSGSIFELLQIQKGKLNFLRNQEALGGKKFGRFEEIQREATALRQEVFRLQKDLVNINKLGLSQAGELAFADATKQRQEDLLNRARELEVQKVEEILSIEAAITEEKIEQTKEAQKALGLLSTEDKLKVLSQAEFFRKNPDRKLTTLEQFLGTPETNRLNEQFFGRNLQKGFDPEKAFDRFLLSSGIGKGDEDLERADTRIEQLVGGGNRVKFFEDLQKLAIEALKLQQVLSGKSVEGLNPNDALSRAVQLGEQLNVNVNLSKADFDPLIRAFEEATSKELLNTRNELVKEIKTIWDRLRAVPGFDDILPGRAPG